MHGWKLGGSPKMFWTIVYLGKLVVEWCFMIPKSWRVRVYIFVISGWQKTHEPKNPTTPKMCFFYNAANSFTTTNHPGNSCLMSGKKRREKPSPMDFCRASPPKKHQKEAMKGWNSESLFYQQCISYGIYVYTYLQIYGRYVYKKSIGSMYYMFTYFGLIFNYKLVGRYSIWLDP